jgi:hypothetical protein
VHKPVPEQNSNKPYLTQHKKIAAMSSTNQQGSCMSPRNQEQAAFPSDTLNSALMLSIQARMGDSVLQERQPLTPLAGTATPRRTVSQEVERREWLTAILHQALEIAEEIEEAFEDE